MTAAIGALKWGFNTPGLFLWATVAREPYGRVRVVDELKFQHKPEDVIAELIAERSARLGLTLQRSYADESLFNLSNPETRKTVPVETPADVFRRNGLSLTPVSGDVEHQWQRLHDYLRPAPDGIPWMVFAPACRIITRTLPTLTQRKTNPDDVDPAGPSFAAHALRVLVSARPSPSALKQHREPFGFMTLGWLKSMDDAPDPRAVLRRLT